MVHVAMPTYIMSFARSNTAAGLGKMHPTAYIVRLVHTTGDKF